jgi:hypothetical protein
VPGEQRPEHLVPAAEVVVDGRRVALPGGAHDLGDRHVVDAALGEQAGGGVEELLAGVGGCGHGSRTVVSGATARTEA